MQVLRALLPVLSLGFVLLAGCADDPPSSDGPDAGSTGGGLHGGHNAAQHLLAPNHTLGDWWTWTSPQIDGPYTSVLAADESLDWLMATNHPDIAWFDARFDIASLGQVRKSDLAGSQGSTRVEFFQFPLIANKTWTTTWDGEPMTVLVTGVSDGVASLEAKRADGTLYAKYTYVDRHGYFGKIDYYDPNGTDVGFASEVTSSGNGFTGDLVRWDYETALESTGPIAGEALSQNLPVPLTATDVYVDLFVQCASGTFMAGVAPLPIVPSIAGVEDRGAGTDNPACPMSMAFSGSAGAPQQTVPESTEEQWGFSAAGDPAAVGTYTFNIYIRTQSVYQVAAAV